MRTIRLLGAFQVRSNESEVPLGHRHDRALLSYLCLNQQRRIERDFLAELLWGSSQGRRHSLAQSLYRVCKRLPWLELERHSDYVRLTAANAIVDVLQILDGSHDAQGLSFQSITQDFLADTQIPDAVNFEQWRDATRASIINHVSKVLGARIEAAEKTKNWTSAIENAQILLKLQPYDERAVCALASALSSTDKLSVALAELDDFIKSYNGAFASHGKPDQAIAFRNRLAAAYSAISEVEGSSPVRSRFVGRQVELKRLADLLRAAERGRCQAIALFGQPGTGKSRLAEQFLRLATIKGARIFSGKCAQAERRVPYSGIGATIQNGVRSTDLRTLGPQWIQLLERLVPQISTGDAFDPGGRDVTARWLFEGAARLLENICAATPLVLCIEDVHWADAGTISLLSYVRRRLIDSPILILLTVRTAEARWNVVTLDLLQSTVEPIERLDVGPLGTDELFALAHATLESANIAISDDEVAGLVSQCGGNPLFLIELIRNTSTTESARFNFDDVKRTIPIYLPKTIETFIQNRLQRLPKESKHVLDAVVVLGAQATLKAVARICGEEDEATLRGLEELSAQGMIAENAGVISVSHDMVRQAIYENMTSVRRTELHRRVALMPLPNSFRAIHANEGNLPELARTTSRLAAREAAAIGADGEADFFWRLCTRCCGHGPSKREVAIEYSNFLISGGRLGQALKLLSRRDFPSVGDRGDEVVLIRRLIRIMKALSDGRRHTELLAALARRLLADLPGGLDNPASYSVLVLLAEAAHDAGEAALARSLANDVLQFANASGTSSVQAEAYAFAARLLAFYGDNGDDVAALCENAFRVARQTGRPNDLITAEISIATAAFLGGGLAAAERHFQTAIAIAESRGSLRFLQRMYNNYGVILLEGSRLEESRAMFEKSLGLSNQHDRVYAHANLAAWAYETNEIDLMHYHGAAVLEANARLAAKWATVAGNSFVGLALLGTDKFAGADLALEQIRRAGRPRSNADDRSYEQVFRARHALARDGTQAALEVLADGLRRMQRGSVFGRARVSLEEARVLLDFSPRHASLIATKLLESPELAEATRVRGAASDILSRAESTA